MKSCPVFEKFLAVSKFCLCCTILVLCHFINLQWNRGCIFSRVRPSYEQAVSDLDRPMHILLWVQVAHSSFIEGSHMTKNTASAHFKRCKKYWNTNISFYIETSGGQNSNIYLNVVHFFNTSVNQTFVAAKTVIFLHRCLICTLLLH